MTAVKVEIVRFVDEHQPGFIEFVLVDAAGRLHTFVEKVPVVTTQDLSAGSRYPCSGVIRCRVIGAAFLDSAGRELVRISTHQPDQVESVEGETDFVVACCQLAGDAYQNPA